jgi:Ca-activated chloride channel family protein
MNLKTQLVFMGLIVLSSACSPSALPVQANSAYGSRGVDSSWPGPAPANNLFASDRLARNYYFVIDGSGSMGDHDCDGGGRKIDTAKRAITEFFSSMPDDVNVGLFVFDNNNASERVPLSIIDKKTLYSRVMDISVGDGTPLGSAMKTGYSKLLQQGWVQQGYGEYHLVLLTDGDAEDPRMVNKMVSEITMTSPVNIHTIGFCIGESHSLNQPGIVNYLPANNAKQLVDSLRGIASESESFSVDNFE